MSAVLNAIFSAAGGFTPGSVVGQNSWAAAPNASANAAVVNSAGYLTCGNAVDAAAQIDISALNTSNDFTIIIRFKNRNSTRQNLNFFTAYFGDLTGYFVGWTAGYQTSTSPTTATDLVGLSVDDLNGNITPQFNAPAAWGATVANGTNNIPSQFQVVFGPPVIVQSGNYIPMPSGTLTMSYNTNFTDWLSPGIADASATIGADLEISGSGYNFFRQGPNGEKDFWSPIGSNPSFTWDGTLPKNFGQVVYDGADYGTITAQTDFSALADPTIHTMMLEKHTTSTQCYIDGNLVATSTVNWARSCCRRC